MVADAYAGSAWSGGSVNKLTVPIGKVVISFYAGGHVTRVGPADFAAGASLVLGEVAIIGP